MKNFFLAFCCIIVPIIILFILGIMQGIWFDTENLMEREDFEIYHPPLWQYITYYSTLILLSIINVCLVIMYGKQGRVQKNISWLFYVLIIFYFTVFGLILI